MAEIKYEIDDSCQAVITAIQQLLAKRKPPVIVALDGGSGCGKSTIAKCVAKELDAGIVPCDDFFAANITDKQWDARTAVERANDAIDWRRLRSDVLEPLIAGGITRWQAFDFESGKLADGTYAMSNDIKTLEPRPIIILDGIYSARQELSDLVDLSILIDVPIAVRHARLAEREEVSFLKAWHERWDGAELWYLTVAKPPESFDLVITHR